MGKGQTGQRWVASIKFTKPGAKKCTHLRAMFCPISSSFGAIEAARKEAAAQRGKWEAEHFKVVLPGQKEETEKPTMEEIHTKIQLRAKAAKSLCG